MLVIVDVAFLYQDMERLRHEESLTSDSSAASGAMNSTQTC